MLPIFVHLGLFGFLAGVRNFDFRHPFIRCLCYNAEIGLNSPFLNVGNWSSQSWDLCIPTPVLQLPTFGLGSAFNCTLYVDTHTLSTNRSWTISASLGQHYLPSSSVGQCCPFSHNFDFWILAGVMTFDLFGTLSSRASAIMQTLEFSLFFNLVTEI